LDYTVIFFLAFFLTFIGAMPPGMLNMTAAKISLKEGHVRGIVFSLGVCVINLLQIYLAAIFSRYLSKHPEVISILRFIGLVIFILITVYFFFIAKSNPKQQIDPKIKSKHSRFFQGAFLAVINVFPIPYHAYVTITLASFGWMTFANSSIITYLSGAIIGTFVPLYLYIYFFDKIKSKTFTSQKNMNRIIGSVTGIISVITLINILNDI
jgi:threonine/homoserine/homoserine lactone efflux protein